MVVEDEDSIGRLLRSSLSSHGYDVSWQRTGQGALRDAPTVEPDLVLLDLGLPDLDGVEVCRQLRGSQPGTVIVILTARDEEMDVVIGLDAGADDYLTKPVRLAELHARVRAHLRRGGPAAASGALAPTHMLGPLRVDTAARRASLSDQPIELRAREFDLLARMAAEPGVALHRNTLMTDVWGQGWYGQTKTLDVHIAALRRKLTEAAERHDTTAPEITTVRGHGFRLEQRETR
jgi:DNA-binding response OmpR family regulator